MHKYERFIIYPLLIVALFYGFAGEQMGTTAQEVMDKLVVREISVVNSRNNEVINIGNRGMFGGGSFEIYNATNNAIVTLSSTIEGSGAIEVYGKEGNMLIAQSVNEEGGGSIGIFNRHNNIVIGLGQTVSDELGIGGGHGLINVYDKYGEDFRSYKHGIY